jgi:hypothetical protein
MYLATSAFPLDPSTGCDERWLPRFAKARDRAMLLLPILMLSRGCGRR